MRGLDKVDIEFALMAIAHNLRKWVKMRKSKPVNSPIDNKTAQKTVNSYIIAKIYNQSRNAA